MKPLEIERAVPEPSELRLEIEDYLSAQAETEEGQTWLTRLKQQMRARAEEIGHARHAAACERAWRAEYSTWTVGQHVWCNMDGFMLGGSVQRGSEFVVVAMRKQKQRISLARPGEERKRAKWAELSAAGLLRYNLKAVPPEKPMPKEHIAQLERIGKELFQ